VIFAHSGSDLTISKLNVKFGREKILNDQYVTIMNEGVAA
jgi:hypothetical protein